LISGDLDFLAKPPFPPIEKYYTMLGKREADIWYI
jgi:hypothetical protein